MEPRPEIQSYSEFETCIAQFEKQNIRYQPVLGVYIPRWAETEQWIKARPDFTRSRRPPPDHTVWRTYIRRIADHFAERFPFYEIWNEQDGPFFGNFKVEEYIELLKIASKEIRQAAPQSRIMCGGYASIPDFVPEMNDPWHMNRVLREARSYFDILPYHGHSPYDRFPLWLDTVVATIAKEAPQTPLFLNETAVSATEVGEYRQAVVLMQKLLYSRSRGVMGYCWYDLRDDGFEKDYMEHTFGMLTHDFFPKAVYSVFNMLATNYADGTIFLRNFHTQDVEGYLFRNSSGDLLYGFWGVTDNTRKLLLLSGISGQASRIDMFGNETPLSVCDGELLLEVTGEPATLRLTKQQQPDDIRIAGNFLQWPSDLLYVDSGKAKTFKVKMTNPSKVRRSITLAMTPPAGVTISPEKVVRTLSPKAEMDLKFSVMPASVFRSLPTDRKDLHVTFSIEKFLAAKLDYPFASTVGIPRDNFPAVPQFVLDRNNQVTQCLVASLLAWQGKKDLQARIYLAHRDNVLKIRIDVDDDVFCQSYTGNNGWRGDSIQVYIHVPGMLGFWDMGFSRLPDNAVGMWWNNPPNPTDLDRIGCRVSPNAGNAGTRYELEIPLDVIKLTSTAASDGFLFNCFINDNDGGGRESYLSISPERQPEMFACVNFRP
jgi:hypothetical protein